MLRQSSTTLQIGGLLKAKIMIIFLLTTLAVVSKAESSLEQVLDKHRTTLGSMDAWHEIKTLTLKLEIREPTFEAEAVYRISRSGKMRIDIFSNGRQVFTEAYDGETGWQWQPGEAQAKIITGEKAAALRHGIEMPGHLYTLLDMQANGHKMEYVGDETRQGVKTHLLLLTLKDGHEKYYVIDAGSGVMLASRDQRAFHPDIDEKHVVVESRPADFRELNGVIRPFQIENHDLSNMKWLGTTIITGVKINREIEDAYFDSLTIRSTPF